MADEYKFFHRDGSERRIINTNYRVHEPSCLDPIYPRGEFVDDDLDARNEKADTSNQELSSKPREHKWLPLDRVQFMNEFSPRQMCHFCMNVRVETRDKNDKVSYHYLELPRA